MTYDLIDYSGQVLFSGYPYADARAEQMWRIKAGASSVQIVPHGRAKDYFQPPVLPPLHQKTSPSCTGG